MPNRHHLENSLVKRAREASKLKDDPLQNADNFCTHVGSNKTEEAERIEDRQITKPFDVSLPSMRVEEFLNRHVEHCAR